MMKICLISVSCNKFNKCEVDKVKPLSQDGEVFSQKSSLIYKVMRPENLAYE